MVWIYSLKKKKILLLTVCLSLKLFFVYYIHLRYSALWWLRCTHQASNVWAFSFSFFFYVMTFFLNAKMYINAFQVTSTVTGGIELVNQGSTVADVLTPQRGFLQSTALIQPRWPFGKKELSRSET